MSILATIAELDLTKNIRRINFPHPSEDRLSALAEACSKATFGLNQKDVLDESYRKAGKLDASAFATLFSPYDSGIMDIIRDRLLHGPNIEKMLMAEPYKLNVYGIVSSPIILNFS